MAAEGVEDLELDDGNWPGTYITTQRNFMRERHPD